MSLPELSLVIPFYNEEAGCERVMHRLAEALNRQQIDYELIPVNNGSTDRTGAILSCCARSNPRIKVVTVELNQGYGWGVLCGLAQGAGRFVGYVDGDTQIPPTAAVEVFLHARDHDTDVCKGTRAERADGFRRRVISSIYNLVFHVLFHCPVRDINAKPKIMKKECFMQLDLQSRDWFVDAELIIKAQAYGMRIAEVPIHFLPREQGVSKVRLSAIFEFVKNLLIYRLTAGKHHRSVSQIRTPHGS